MNVSTDIAELWSAGTPVVYIVTREEDRAVALCQAAASAFDARSGVWSSNRGLEPLAPAAKDPAALLDALLKAPPPYLCAALDFHEALASPALVRKLRDLVPRYAAEGRCLAVIAPQLVLPEGLTGDVAVLRLPLPDDGELAALLDAVYPAAAGPGAPPLGPEARHRALVAARGLTEPQARRAFTRAVRRDPELGPEGVAALAAEKSRLLGSDLGLELIDAAERPEDRGVARQALGQRQPRRDHHQAAALGRVPRQEIAQLADQRRRGQRLVEVEGRAQVGRGGLEEHVQQGSWVLGGRRQRLQPAVRGPHARAGVEGAGGRLAQRHRPVLLPRDDVDDGRSRRPELRDLGRDVHIPSASAVARMASSKEVTPAAILRMAWARRLRSPS